MIVIFCAGLSPLIIFSSVIGVPKGYTFSINWRDELAIMVQDLYYKSLEILSTSRVSISGDRRPSVQLQRLHRGRLGVEAADRRSQGRLEEKRT